MKYGFIAYGNLKTEFSKKPMKVVDVVMKEVEKVAKKHDIEVKMYGVPYGVSEDFVVVYESDITSALRQTFHTPIHGPIRSQ